MSMKFMCFASTLFCFLNSGVDLIFSHINSSVCVYIYTYIHNYIYIYLLISDLLTLKSSFLLYLIVVTAALTSGPICAEELMDSLDSYTAQAICEAG